MSLMKDSNIKWLGEIPSDWELRRLQYCLNEIKVKNNPIQTTQVLSLMKDVGVLPYEEKGDIGNKSKENVSEYHLAYPNTIVLNCMNILIGSVGISNYFGCVSPVYYVFKETEQSDLRFINYIFNTREFQKELRKYAKGILEIRLRVSADDIFKRKIALPSKDEQIKIANFLDQKCSEIDSLSADIQSQIDILEEYKKSVITEAVTKGLNPDVEMKDSGIEFIGEIPKDFECKRIKQCIIGMTDGTHGTFQRTQEGKLLLSAKNVFEDGLHISDMESLISDVDYKNITKNGYPRKNDVLLCCVGTVGRCMVYTEDEPIAFQRSVLFLRCNDKIILPKMLFYCLQSNPVLVQEKLSITKSAQDGLYQGSVAELRITFPKDKNIQQKIVNYLDNKCSEIDKTITEKKQQLETLSEYKKSLIYEYVTGKKEVPENV